MRIWINISAVWNCLLFAWTVNPASLPNIVIHLADDMGIGDVGCYGNTTLRTPNIDQLATEGIRLTQHFAAEAICTPSRAALLTGRYPIRSGFANGFVPVRATLPAPGGIPEEEVTFAEQVEKAGYKTALIGKWHLGLYDFFRRPVHHPLNHGFHRFYGVPFGNAPEWGGDPPIALRMFPNLKFNMAAMLLISLPSFFLFGKLKLIGLKTCILMSMAVILPISYLYIQYIGGTFMGSVLMRDYDVIEQPVRVVGLTRRFAMEGIEFVREVSREGTPFLLFMSWGHTHSYLAPSEKFAGKTQHGRYGDCVEELDWGIGLVNDVLDELHLKENTLVYFTSDNGGDRWEGGGYNGIYKGGKTQCSVDGGIHVPGVVRFPGRIPPNTYSDVVTSQMDLFPLISHLAGAPLPEDRCLDGENIISLLEGKPDGAPKRSYLMHYSSDEVSAVRYTPKGGDTVWKIVYKIPDSLYLPNETICAFGVCNCKLVSFLDQPLLFDMTSDPSERHPIKPGEHPEYDDIVKNADHALEKHLTTIEHVPNQLSAFNSFWQPHLISCCNWPLCHCIESKYPNTLLK